MTDFSRRELIKVGLAASAAFASPLAFSSPLDDQTAQAFGGPESKGDVFDLSGNWRFARDDSKTGVIERWFAGALPANKSGPAFIPLPGTTDEAGVGHPNPDPPTLIGLYRPNRYTGPAWYQREIVIPPEWKGKSISLFLERTHWITRAWLDERELGSQESLIAPHIHDLGTGVQPGKHLLTLCIDNTILFDLGRFASVNYEGTQTNWNGVVGRIELRAKDLVSIGELRVFPDVDNRAVIVKLRIKNVSGHAAKGTIRFNVQGAEGPVRSEVSADFSCPGTEAAIEKTVPMGSDVKLWGEFSPTLYILRATLTAHGRPSQSDMSTAVFGMRKLGIEGKQFTLNGRPLLLRGTLECAIFPLTGYPPTDISSWRRIYQIEKSYGLDYIRFHSWTPPEAAFTAADIEGILIQTEGPQSGVPTGIVAERDAFVERELLRIVDTYGNHPSFALMTLGNEFGGSLEVITRWVDLLLAQDGRHFYSSASNNRMRSANRQFTESAGIRGVHGPGTTYDYDLPVSNEDRPFIGHEIGQWTFFPDLDEVRKYTGVLKAENFTIVAEDLTKRGMRDQARLFLEATGRQAILLYKDEIESIRRTKDYAGFSLLDLHDYPGQGTALVGLLDPFWDSKGLISPKEHAAYAGPVAPLLRFEKRTYLNDETFEGLLDLSNFGPSDLNGIAAAWSITTRAGELVASGSLAPANAPTGTLTRLGTVRASLAAIHVPQQLKVTVSLPESDISNGWDIWAFPSVLKVEASAEITVAHEWGREAKAALANGESVIVFPSSLPMGNVLKGSFKPVFWSAVWFHLDPATMGILVNPDHPLFTQFPTDFYSDWQWYSLIEGSESVILDDAPLEYRPLVQVIDNPARNHRLGTVFEAKVGNGRLLVCTLFLNQGEPEKRSPEQRQFLHSLYTYAASPMFAPKQELDVTVLDHILGGSQ